MGAALFGSAPEGGGGGRSGGMGRSLFGSAPEGGAVGGVGHGGRGRPAHDCGVAARRPWASRDPGAGTAPLQLAEPRHAVPSPLPRPQCGPRCIGGRAVASAYRRLFDRRARPSPRLPAAGHQVDPVAAPTRPGPTGGARMRRTLTPRVADPGGPLPPPEKETQASDFLLIKSLAFPRPKAVKRAGHPGARNNLVKKRSKKRLAARSDGETQA